ncbi:MAG TPA: hypothetical protein PLU80_09660, partial [Acidobacteriota bacterium]|nr:hypothetical protein [Acidobacteriota bacterium]
MYLQPNTAEVKYASGTAENFGVRWLDTALTWQVDLGKKHKRHKGRKGQKLENPEVNDLFCPSPQPEVFIPLSPADRLELHQ